MTDVDIYGNIVDAETVETFARDSLQAWILAHLAHQERRRELTARTLPAPRSWPTVSEFTLEAPDQLPSIVLVSPGTSGSRLDRGSYNTAWRLEVAVAIAGKDEREARLLASIYLAAIKGALAQDTTLLGTVEHCRLVGPDDHAYGTTDSGAQRAIYGTAFEITVRDALNTRKGPPAPPEDPYDTPAAPVSPLTADIVVLDEAP